MREKSQVRDGGWSEYEQRRGTERPCVERGEQKGRKDGGGGGNNGVEGWSKDKQRVMIMIVGKVRGGAKSEGGHCSE